MKLAIIHTGGTNINSVRFAFERLGIEPSIISDPLKLKQAERAVLPGIGYASLAMERLNHHWRQAINEYERPLLGICLGMQLLCEYSMEGDVSTLGHIPGKIRPLAVGSLTSPHMGWNTLSILKPHPLIRSIKNDDYVYFVHSFAHSINEQTLVSSEYGQTFSAIIAHNNYIGMQFHPERSAKVGAQLLQNFLDWM
jgi:glutamine amidotransferase